jgi:hypothetical protein
VEYRQHSYTRQYNVVKSLQGALEGRNKVTGGSGRQTSVKEAAVKHKNEYKEQFKKELGSRLS